MTLPLSHLSLLPSSSFSSPSLHSQLIPIAAFHSQKTQQKSLILRHGSFPGTGICREIYGFSVKRSVIVHASSEIDGGGETKAEEESIAPVESLPLESKLKERMEQKLRMKMAKKIRLRRKRLLRKRKMRKKGRWPPSKMKKLKNV